MHGIKFFQSSNHVTLTVVQNITQEKLLPK